MPYVKDIQVSLDSGLGTRKCWPVELQPENLGNEKDSQQSQGTTVPSDGGGSTALI